jgi:hypothetical protein
MKIYIDIPIPSKIELLLARLFGEYFHKSCMDSHISGYKWRGKTYLTKTWTDEDYQLD